MGDILRVEGADRNLSLGEVATILRDPPNPVVAVVGGATASSKLTVLRALMDWVDRLILGGGTANTFLLASGHQVGASAAEPELRREATAIIDVMRERGASVLLPQDVVVARSPAAPHSRVVPVEAVADDVILDIGPRSAAAAACRLTGAGTILWNGPLGVFEAQAYARGTGIISQAIAGSNAVSLALGDATLAAIDRFGLLKRITCVPSRGRGLRDLLEDRARPFEAALETAASCVTA